MLCSVLPAVYQADYGGRRVDLRRSLARDTQGAPTRMGAPEKAPEALRTGEGFVCSLVSCMAIAETQCD